MADCDRQSYWAKGFKPLGRMVLDATTVNPLGHYCGRGATLLFAAIRVRSMLTARV